MDNRKLTVLIITCLSLTIGWQCTCRKQAPSGPQDDSPSAKGLHPESPSAKVSGTSIPESNVLPTQTTHVDQKRQSGERCDGTLSGDRTCRKLRFSRNDLADSSKDTIDESGCNVGILSMAVGFIHTCVVRRDFTLWCWGHNGSGQLGDGTNVNRTIPTQVGKSQKWKAIAVGLSHTCGTQTDGSLWCWGGNKSGQLGDGTNVGTSKPTQFGTTKKWKAIAAGLDHTCGLQNDGSLWCWGGVYLGSRVDRRSLAKARPNRIGGRGKWKSLAAGRGHSCGIRLNGSIWCWGMRNRLSANRLRS